MYACVRICIVKPMYSINIIIALVGANEDDTQIFTKRVVSSGFPDTPLCYGDVVDLMCYMIYSNGGYVQKNKLDC